MRNFKSHKIVTCICLYLKKTENGLKLKNSSVMSNEFIQDFRLKLNKLQ